MGSVLEWEENIFLGLKALYKRLVEAPRHQQLAEVRVSLAPLRQELFLFARMVAERPVPIIETPQAVLCDDTHLFLPAEFSIAGTIEGNEALYRLKTLLGGLALRSSGLPNCGQPLAEQIRWWSDEFPALPAWVDALNPHLKQLNLWQVLGEPKRGSGSESRASTKVIVQPAQVDTPEKVTEIEGQGQIDVKVRQDPGEQPVESEMPIHTFEKAETLEEYSGLDRKTDDDDELEDHAEALRSLQMTQVMRSQERPRSIYRADVVMEGLSLDVADNAAGTGIPYPEWDFQKQCHKPAWCFVRQNSVQEADEAWVRTTERKHRASILDLRKKLAALATQTQRAKRQPFGEELDIDAIVAAKVDLFTGHAPDERLYIHRQRKLHDVAAAIVMDQSFSTDAWIDDARVLDTIRETLFCVGEVLDEFIESFAVAGFSSNTRRQCDFNVIKDFAEPWRNTRARLGGLTANGYTRIGAALRHAQELLIRQPAERRVIFLLTDGRPCDYDRYEGDYGIHDVRRAIETGKRHGILTHAFAVEKRAREQFPRMFSRQHYDIVPNPRALVASMCNAFARLKLPV